MTTPLLLDLRRALGELADPTRAAGAQAYMKSAKHRLELSALSRREALRNLGEMREGRSSRRARAR